MDKDCRRVATLKSDLSGIPASEFEIVDSGHGNWYKVSYDIEMSFEATLSFRLVFKGTVIFHSTLSTADRAELTLYFVKGKVIGQCDVDYGR